MKKYMIIALLLTGTFAKDCFAEYFVSKIEFKCTGSGSQDEPNVIDYAQYGQNRIMENTARDAAEHICGRLHNGSPYDVRLTYH